MKTKKLNLNDLKVESFVTNVEPNNSNTVKGGSTGGCTATIIIIVATATATAYTLARCTDGVCGTAKFLC